MECWQFLSFGWRGAELTGMNWLSLLPRVRICSWKAEKAASKWDTAMLCKDVSICFLGSHLILDTSADDGDPSAHDKTTGTFIIYWCHSEQCCLIQFKFFIHFYFIYFHYILFNLFNLLKFHYFFLLFLFNIIKFGMTWRRSNSG